MKTSFACMVLGIAASVSLTSQTSEAGEFDLRVGSFNGYWCGYAAQFDIQSKDRDKWIFRGKILIKATGQYDQVWIEQYANNSLRIIRYLSGPNSGRTQVAQTYRPEMKFFRGQLHVNFPAQAVNGVGSQPTGGRPATTYLRMPRG